MKTKVKNIVVTVAISLFFLIGFLMCIFHEPVDVSESERRVLAKFPELTWAEIIDGTNINEFEDYTLDQFPLRDTFRGIKAWVSLHIFRQMDNNDIYVVDGSVSKLEYPLDPKMVDYAADHWLSIYNKYIADTDANVYYSVVPDKNYFMAEANGYPALDYQSMIEQLNGKITEMTYIDILDCLEIEDYYKTDSHWSQEKILDVVDRLSTAMGVRDKLSFRFEEKQLGSFHGVYRGQSALPLKKDPLVYLTNDVIENATVFNLETGMTTSVYDLAKFEGLDPYDVFLSGAAAHLTIENPNAVEDRELIVFRDSFGSSLTPLLIEGYSKITVLDTRYIMSAMLGNVVDFSSADDILFIYSAAIINNSTALK
jgi:hypothetical protein